MLFHPALFLSFISFLWHRPLDFRHCPGVIFWWNHSRHSPLHTGGKSQLSECSLSQMPNHPTYSCFDLPNMKTDFGSLPASMVHCILHFPSRPRVNLQMSTRAWNYFEMSYCQLQIKLEKSSFEERSAPCICAAVNMIDDFWLGCGPCTYEANTHLFGWWAGKGAIKN